MGLTVVYEQSDEYLQSLPQTIESITGRKVDYIDRGEFFEIHGWQPNDRVLPALYIGGEGERSVWVSASEDSHYNIFDYLQCISSSK